MTTNHADKVCPECGNEAWHSRWGLPRYHATLDRHPPYRNGLEGRAA